MKLRRCVFTVILTLLVASLHAQDRPVPFDRQGTIFEIMQTSPYADIWKTEIPEFNRLLAFDADSLIQIEIYRQISGAPIRERKLVERAWFESMQTRMDSVASVVVRQGGPLMENDVTDLRTTFTIDQTGYSAVHGLTIATLLESPAAFWIVTGGSYFAVSALSDNMNVTRANVEAASYGHLTGLVQGYAGGIALFAGPGTDGTTSVKAVFATASICGIVKAISSYDMMNGPDVDPTTQYLRLVTERHSLLWGAGAAMIAVGDDGDARTVMGVAVATSLSSLLWSKTVFGLDNRKMSWGDALLVDEFMTPWYLTLAAAAATFEIKGTRAAGTVLTLGGIGGYLLGINLNEGGMRELSTVKRTRLLMYGGSLLGIGIVAGAELKDRSAWWIIAGTSWLGYFVGTRSDKPVASSSWDVDLMPEGMLLGSLDRSSLIPRPATIAQLSIRL